MKKRFALLLGVLLILVAAFASCGQAAATDKRPRWAASETYTFNITLSDFASQGASLFNNYSRQFSKTGEDGKVTTTTLTCYKDDIISSNEAAIMNSSDQLRPVDVSGTYTLKVKEEGTNWKATTDQIIYSQYETATLRELGCLDLFNGSDRNVTDKDENPFENDSERITLRSETKSEVIFGNDDDQLPVSSYTKNVGYYIGKTAQVESAYEYETTYDIAGKKVSVKKNGGEAQERSLNIANNAKLIDANQLLLYIRSLDKSDNAFQSVPSVAVYDVTSDSVLYASFTLNRQFNLKIDNADATETILSVNAVNATVGGMPFIAQYNLPDITGTGSGYDYLPISGGKRSRYTTVKFRSGWYSYEIQPDEEFKQTLDAVKVTGAN